MRHSRGPCLHRSLLPPARARQQNPDLPLIFLKCAKLARMNQTPAQTALNKAMIRWSLSRATLLAETRTSWIYKVEQDGREPAVLKQLKPDAGDDEELRGSALLAWYAGQGAATVFDAADGIVFMEWLDGASLGDAARAGRDDEATVAIAALVRELHQPREADPPPLQPLRFHFRALFDMQASRWPAKGRDLLARSLGTAHRLFDRPAPSVPLHGDLHHDNIIASRRGWLAIDPKGMIGDPAYEVANLFRNPHGAPRVFADAARIARRADILEARLGYTRKRILAYAAAHCALSICWDIEAQDRDSISQSLDVLPLLLAACDAA
jgi:streptomycin 6-kinase